MEGVGQQQHCVVDVAVGDLTRWQKKQQGNKEEQKKKKEREETDNVSTESQRHQINILLQEKDLCLSGYSWDERSLQWKWQQAAHIEQALEDSGV